MGTRLSTRRRGRAALLQRIYNPPVGSHLHRKHPTHRLESCRLRHCSAVSKISTAPNRRGYQSMPITVHNGETLKNATYVVEEHIFINCKLTNCRLMYHGGSFEWANTTFENCMWGFRDHARNMMTLM